MRSERFADEHVRQGQGTGSMISSVPAADQLFQGAGEMRSLCRSYDWSETPLGPPHEWPQSLRTTVQTMLATPAGAVVLWGAELTQIYNDGYRDVMGHKHPRGLGQATRSCWPEVWPLNFPIYERVQKGETVTLLDALFPIARSGKELEDAWFSVTYVPVRDDDGDVAGIMVGVEERTQSVRSARDCERLILERDVEHDRLDEAFRQSPSFIAVFRGEEMCFEFVNDSFYELIGGRQVLGHTLLEAVPELDAQGFGPILRGVRTKGVSWVGRESLLDLRRGEDSALEKRYVDIVVHPMRDPDGTIFGVVAHGSDVTAQVLARKSAERVLVDSRNALAYAEAARQSAEISRREAEEANLAKGRFLAVMSHELRTPLNAIGGYAELLEMGIRGPVNDTQMSDLKRIQSSKNHLLSLINEVLDYAKLETGTLQYSLQKVLVRTSLSAAEALIAPQAAARQLGLQLVACDDRLAAHGDPDKILQILLNLLSNAVKFTNPGGAVRIGCAPGDDTVRFTVQDTGVGIAAHDLADVFEPFVQINSDKTRSHEGTGLGLAISRELARGMGGELRVTSEHGRGSTFTLSLPRAPQ
jgi:signal transduction histidine kinase